MRIIISALHYAADCLDRLSEMLSDQSSEWFTNRTGHLSFRPQILPNGKGQFTAAVLRRTGCCSRDWQVQKFTTAGNWRSPRQAMKAARRMARDLAFFRYRFN